MCSECRAYHKKTGELPPVPPTPPGGRDSRDSPYLFRPVQADEAAAAAAGRMRTRTRAKEAVSSADHLCLDVGLIFVCAAFERRKKEGEWHGHTRE